VRIFTGALATETNTFSPMPADMALFKETFFAEAGKHPDEPGFMSGPTFAARKRAKGSNIEVIEGLHALAMPAGRTVRHVYEELRDQLLAELEAAMPVDVVALGLHGAMAADGYDDCEGDILERARRIVGPRVAVGTEIDPHCHLTDKMVRNADAIVIMKEYPHTDFLERGDELLDILIRTARGEVKPVASVHDCRMLVPFRPTRQPARGLVDKIKAMEGKDGILSVSLVHGFAYGDVDDLGSKVLVVTDNNKAHGDKVAADLGREIWEKRDALTTKLLSPDEALDEALKIKESPVVIADPADNAGGGAPSDSTFFVRLMLKRRIKNAANAPIWDPGAVKLCFAAGLGGTLELRFGGKLGPTSGDPIDAKVKVIGLVRNARQPFGDAFFDMGDMAGIAFDGISVVLSSNRVQAYHPDLFRLVGIDPLKTHILVVKSTNHFVSGFGPVAKQILYSDGPGALAGDPRRITYTKRKKPMWPFEADPWSKS
jgi:microcystin degradation protein MlrC